MIYSYSVFPLICKPTRVTKTTATLIDHILTNNFDVDSHHNQGILCSSISDHFTVFHIAGNKMGDTGDQTSPVLQRNFNQRNINRFINEMNNVDWKPTLDANELEAAYNNFQTHVSNMYNNCFPLTRMKKRYYNNKPWLTPALKQSIKVKNKKYVNRNKGPDPVQREIEYKRFKNRLNHLLRVAERKFLSDLIMKHKSNLKKTWQIMKGVINKNKYKPNCNKFNHNGKIIDDGKEIANRFNNFFVNVGTNLASKIPIVDKRPSDYMKHINIENVFEASIVSEDEIFKIITNFKDSAAGWDGIKPSVIKHVKNSVLQPLAHICNLSFTTGRFPNALKIANVIPIYKSSDEMEFSNYRPVSILPVFSKILERLMYNRLIQYINDNNLLYKFQFGFQKGKSTSMALMMLVDKISEALDKGEMVIGVFLDFSKAFDTVDHDILIEKMNIYGIRGIYNQWFRDYLSNRKQFVTYNKFQSESSAIKCGVPQGSILGPLLFLLYINDLSTVSSALLSILFADDTNMFISGRNIQGMCDQMNSDLKVIENWLYCNKLSLNVLKTHYMIFTPRKIVEDINLYVNNTPIQRVYVTKFLGVQIDSKLSWKSHIDYICKKLSKCVAIFAKARRKLPKSCLISLYYSIAYPYFIYCNHVWGNNYSAVLKKLVLVQKKIIRIITNSPFRAHTEPLFFANNILNVTDIYDYTACIFMYKNINPDETTLFTHFFQRKCDIHAYPTSRSQDLHVPRCKINIRKFSIRINGPKVWNSIPVHIRDSFTPLTIKWKLKKYLQDRV